MRCLLRAAMMASAATVPCGVASAQTTVVLPDTSQTTMATVAVLEQARVIVPAGIAFSVADVATATPSNPVSVTLAQVVLASDTRQLSISLRAGAPSFAPPVAGATTWTAGDVSWNAAAWTAGTGVSGTLSAASYTSVAVCGPGAAACATSALIFSLAPKPAVQRSGTHTLIATWKVESIGF